MVLSVAFVVLSIERSTLQQIILIHVSKANIPNETYDSKINGLKRIIRTITKFDIKIDLRIIFVLLDTNSLNLEHILISYSSRAGLCENYNTTANI